jgi:hypothetical protein
MKTLGEIIDAVRSGDKPEYDELRYAVCVMDALATFDRQAFMRLAANEELGKKPFMNTSAVWQWNEFFERMKRAMEKCPKDWIGWNNDPDNPDFLKRRNEAKQLLSRLHGSA